MNSELIIPLLIVLLAVMMFFQSRRQRRTAQNQQKMQNSLVPGDRVMTTSGVYGTVVDTGDDTIDLEIAPGITTTWVRAALREKVNTDSAESEISSDDSEIAHDEVDATEQAGAELETESKAQVAEPIEKTTSK